MRKTSTLFVALAVGVAALVVGANPVFACDYSKRASLTTASVCRDACAKNAATVTANKPDCCKASVNAVMASWAEISAAKAAKTKTAAYEWSSTYGCRKSAAAKTAKAGCSYEAAAAKVAANVGECCRETMNAFTTAVYANMASCYASAQTARSKSASVYSCSRNAAVRTAGSYSCSRSASTASLAELPYHEGRRIVLTGNTVCGKCVATVTDNCQTVFQTADGKYYLLLENNRVEDMKETKANDGFEIVTYVRKLDGTKYLEVKTYKVL